MADLGIKGKVSIVTGSARGIGRAISAPMATSKSPTCGRVKIPHPGDRIECTNLEEKGPYFFLFHPGFFAWFRTSVKPLP
jgi:hypothetical protein